MGGRVSQSRGAGVSLGLGIMSVRFLGGHMLLIEHDGKGFKFVKGIGVMNWDFRALRQRPVKSDGLRSHPFTDRINLQGARPCTLVGKVS
jgi:hypothetical protein